MAAVTIEQDAAYWEVHVKADGGETKQSVEVLVGVATKKDRKFYTALQESKEGTELIVMTLCNSAANVFDTIDNCSLFTCCNIVFCLSCRVSRSQRHYFNEQDFSLERRCRGCCRPTVRSPHGAISVEWRFVAQLFHQSISRSRLSVSIFAGEQ